jgi:hypothetical protein
MCFSGRRSDIPRRNTSFFVPEAPAIEDFRACGISAGCSFSASRLTPKDILWRDLRNKRVLTKHPTALWIAQQLREAFPYDISYKYLIYDRAAKFSEQVGEAVKALALDTPHSRPVVARTPNSKILSWPWLAGCTCIIKGRPFGVGWMLTPQKGNTLL